MTRPDVKSQRTPMSRESGFTIVELMVGMLIGLISIVVMFQIFAVSEGQRRTTSGAGDAQQNGVTSLYLMERDVRTAGYGLNYYRLLGCKVDGYWAPTAKTFSFNFAPATIVNGAGGTAPDTLTAVYADTEAFAFPSIVGANVTAGFVKITDSLFVYKPGHLFVIGNIPPSGPIMNDCSLFQVTSLAGVTDTQRLNFAGSTYVDDGGTTYAAKYTPPSAVSGTQVAPNNVSFTKWQRTTGQGARMYNMGAQPTVMQYSIVNNQLVAKNILTPDDPATPIADGIVQFQAQYGISGAPLVPPVATPGCQAAPQVIVPCFVGPAAPSLAVGSWVVDNWADALPTGALAPLPQNWRQIIAIRFVLVARSGQQEKVDPVSGQCKTTQTMPVWSVNNQTLDLSADPNWKCYRYQKFESVVPIRNMNWFADPNGTNEPQGE
jgi:type IV pilus assembly protein PilW